MFQSNCITDIDQVSKSVVLANHPHIWEQFFDKVQDECCWDVENSHDGSGSQQVDATKFDDIVVITNRIFSYGTSCLRY